MVEGRADHQVVEMASLVAESLLLPVLGEEMASLVVETAYRLEEGMGKASLYHRLRLS